jgi:hypothetical protein
VSIPSITSNTHVSILRASAQTGRTTTPATLDLGTITAGGNVFLMNATSIDVDSITAGGETQMFATLPVNIGTLTTNGYTRVSSSETITADRIQGVDLDLRSAMGITANTLIGTTSVAVGTAGPATIGSITGPTLTMDTSNARLGTVTISGDARIRTTDFDLTGSFSAANFAIESQVGTISVGGTAEPGLTDEEFQRIQVSGMFSIYAGQREPSVNVPVPVFGTMTVGDLRVDPSRIPRLQLFANLEHELRIEGVLDVTESGGELQIGTSEVDSPWAPGAIIVTGAIGSASGDALTGFTDVHAFESVELHATDDILMGASRFVELVSPVPAAEIDIGRGLPTGVAATTEEQGKLFVVAGNLSLTANDRIVQQNTGALGTEGGLYLTGAGVEPDEPLLVVGRAQVGDLFGAFASSDGVLTIGSAGAFSSRIARDPDDMSAGAIRINGCPLGIGCAVFTPANQFRVEQFRPAAVRVAVDPPVLTPPPTPHDDERESEAITTGTGNEEIWRRDR